MQYRVALVTCAFIAPSLVFGGDDTTPPVLKSLRFAPDAIQIGTVPVEVTVDFTVTDDGSGVTFFEATFVDPTGVLRQSASLKFPPARSMGNSVKVTFPPFSNSGAWTLAQVFVTDAAGNTLVLDADGIRSRGFPTRLDVTSVKDTTSPALAALSFAPAQIDTSGGSADVKVDYTVTDDLSGVAYLELAFLGPSGIARRGGSVKFEPARSISKSMTLTFPRLSEAGRWTLSTVFLADAAGNTTMLNAERLARMGIPTTIEVKSASDTVSPSLTALRVFPDAINTSAGPASVKVEFAATDDFSGVKSIEVTFVSPSGAGRFNGSAVFSPAKEVTGSIDVNFPPSSEQGQWVLGQVFVVDAAGNTLVLNADALVRAGFRGSVLVR